MMNTLKVCDESGLDILLRPPKEPLYLARTRLEVGQVRVRTTC